MVAGCWVIVVAVQVLALGLVYVAEVADDELASVVALAEVATGSLSA